MVTVKDSRESVEKRLEFAEKKLVGLEGAQMHFCNMAKHSQNEGQSQEYYRLIELYKIRERKLDKKVRSYQEYLVIL